MFITTTIVGNGNSPSSITLTASDSCSCCNGRGEVREAHGEILPCDCIFDEATDEELAAIDSGSTYTIEPGPVWCMAHVASDLLDT